MPFAARFQSIDYGSLEGAVLSVFLVSTGGNGMNGLKGTKALKREARYNEDRATESRAENSRWSQIPR